MWDFWQDAHQEVIEEHDAWDRTVVGPAKKKVAFRLDEKTVALVDEDARIRSIKEAYGR